MPASENASITAGSVPGCTKPRVNIDDPLVSTAAFHPCCSSDQNSAVYPVPTMDSHTTGNSNRLRGAKSASVSSVRAGVRRSRARRTTKKRTARNTARDRRTGAARGSTKVWTAESAVLRIAPAATKATAIRTTTMADGLAGA
jgi:hypothetical protein